jgi:WD40 repeat protein
MQGVDGLVFSPDGKTLVSGAGGFEAIKLWNIETGQKLLTLPGKGSLLSEVKFMENGNTFVAGRLGQRGVWQIWRAPSWEEIAAAEAREAGKNEEPGARAGGKA